ncbi:hypothetical protein DRJ17_00175 [Candidatus Woesearchaeota archaeon]|nr:MAG: hypothetical protein DRJ17_00175 [Candidatus Woesearchaeota archaeon]
MKILFLEARNDIQLKRIKNIEILPTKIGLLGIVQYADQLQKLKETLENSGKEVIFGKSAKTKNVGQILGCDIKAAESIEDRVDAFLFLGDGLFHPRMLLLKLKKPVFFLSPTKNKIYQLKDSDLKRIKIKQKTATIKYLSSKEIGIIVSIKPGQNQTKAAILLKEKLRKQGKNAYLLIADTVDYQQLENFPFIECFVNTACPRIALDDYEAIKKPILNIDDVP